MLSRTTAILNVWGFHLLAGLILVVPALMNHAPLVYSDTGTYITSSRTLFPPIDRPIGYGFMIRAVTWQSTLWTVVFFQGMVASWLIQRTTDTLFPQLRGSWRTHVVILSLLLAFSSLPWYSSQLMPDVYSGMLALCAFLLLFGRGLSRGELLLLGLLFFFFSITHLSYLVILLAVGPGCIVLFWRSRLGRASVRKRRMGLVLVLLTPLLGILFVMGYNARHGHGFVVSPTSSLFLTGKLIESGVMYTYLDRSCTDRPNFLCEHKEGFNTTGMYYVWDENAPTRQGRDMVSASQRLDPVLKDLLGDVSMWPMLAWTSLLSTTLQLVTPETGVDVSAYGKDTAPWWPISHHYRHELPLYMDSVQQRSSWGLGYLNAILMWLMLLSAVVAVVRWPPRRHVRWWAFMVIVVGFLVANAAATGALANVYDRLQARINWLMVFAGILLLANHLRTMRRILCFPMNRSSLVQGNGSEHNTSSQG